MWIAGLSALQKPLLHLHTQFNRDIPWDSIDMDFMNLNQSAHGDREYGFIGSRMNITRKVVVGHWKSDEVRERIGSWMRVAVAFVEGKQLKVARFGDNMREVAVTEGDKVEAQIQFGWSINGYGIGDLVQRIRDIADSEVNELLDEEKVCIHVMMPAHHSSALASRKSFKIASGSVKTGLNTMLKGMDGSGFRLSIIDLACASTSLSVSSPYRC